MSLIRFCDRCNKKIDSTDESAIQILGCFDYCEKCSKEMRDQVYKLCSDSPDDDFLKLFKTHLDYQLNNAGRQWRCKC